MARRPVSTLHRVIEVAVARGVPRALLDALRGPEPWLELPVAERIRRSEAVWRTILDTLDDPGFPIHYARSVSPDDFGILGLAVRSAPDLRHAFDRILRFQGLFTPDPPWAWRSEGEPSTVSETVALGLRVALSSDPRLQAVLSEAWVAELAAVSARMTGAPLELTAVCFAHPAPADVTEHARLFGVVPRFDAGFSGLVLSRAVLDRPLVHADRGISEFLVEQLEELQAAEDAREADALQQQLARFVADALADGGPPSLADAARAVAMSERTLRRRLAEAGTQWKAVVEDTRKTLAQRMLRDGDRSPAEIAWALGFSEPSAFFRAFRRWTGRTPTAWREGRA